MTILSKYKWFFIIVGVVVVAEIIWVFKTLGGNVPVTVNVPVVTQNAFIILTTPKTTFKVGEKIPVSINIDSGKATDGSDIIITYDPNLIIVNAPTEVGKIYEDYPLNTFDNKVGKISVSGITSAITGKVAKGLFGTVTFEAKAPGKAKISVDFTKNSTIDSNIIENKTSKDLLGRVGNVEVEIK
ncbi:MAG: cohesin domain-containing protein [Candidatus Daviesbacteria bacterium]|nr:cohesin domain-containing protein [Candidatus Daviesbacteria bacterium]